MIEAVSAQAPPLRGPHLVRQRGCDVTFLPAFPDGVHVAFGRPARL